MSGLIRKGRAVHKCQTSSPGSLALGSVVACVECGRRWKLGRVGWSFKGWRRTLPTFLRDVVTRRRAINLWASVNRWDEPTEDSA